jgi:hypothetical protein
MPDEVHSIAKPYKLVFEEHPEYFFACVESDVFNSTIIIEYQTKIAREISIRQHHRVMIKRDVPMSHTAGELLGAIYRVNGWQLRGIKYAFVDVDASRLTSYQFALVYARAHGVSVEVFSDIDSAKDWLLAQ